MIVGEHPPLPPEEGGVVGQLRVQYDKRGKPTRRYLAAEIERLFNKNLTLVKRLKTKEDVESELVEVKNRLESEVEELRRRLEAAGRTNVTEAAMRQRNKQLAQDVFIMKNILVRLNAELEKSQDRLRSMSASGGKSDDPPTISEDSGIGDNPKRADVGQKWLQDGEAGALSALLEAYDESLVEKESLVRDYRVELERLAGRVKLLAVENEELRAQLDDLDRKGEVTYSDWLGLQKEVAGVREQNELLVRQTKLGKTKFNELRTAFQTKLNECCSERDDALEKCTSVRTELFLLKGRAAALQEEYTRLKEQSDARVPQSVHMASINECKRLFEELKSRYEDERDSLLKRLAAADAQVSERSERLSSVTAERDTLIERMRHADETNRKLEGKLDESSRALADTERLKEDLRRQLSGTVSFSAELLSEQECLLRQLAQRTEEARIAGNVATRLDSIKTQIQGVETQVSEQMTALDRELRSKADNLQRLRERQAEEVSRLKELVAAKEVTVERLEAEKRKVQEELELVWKAATTSKETKKK